MRLEAGVDENLLRFLRLIIEALEEKAPAALPPEREVELRELLLTMELSEKLKVEKPKPGVDWGRHLPLLLTLAVVIAALIAALLGVDVRSLL